MIKNKIVMAFVLLTSITQAQVTVDWYNYPGGVSIALDASNNSYTANWDYNPGGDITLTKRGPTGNIMWNATYNNTDNTRHEVATWVATDKSGNVLVSGTIRSGYSNPVNAASLLMKFNAAGALLWRVVYESNFDGSSTRKCLVDANNNIYVLGIGTGPNGQVTKVKKFDSTGASVWNYFDAGIGAPVTFKFTPDNKILITHRGITGNFNGYSKIDLNGNNIWSLGGVASFIVGDAAGDAFGNTYIINGGSPNNVLQKLSPTAGIIWSQTNVNNCSKVEVGTDSKPVIGGYPPSTFGVVFLKYDSAGNFLWQNLDADGPGLSLLALTPMRIDASNNVFIAGSTMSSMGVCKVNSNGSSAWATTTPSGYPVWFEFGTDNNVYVTGGTTARFVQPVVCQTPISLSTSNITASQAKFNWAIVPGAVQYEIWHKKATATFWKKRFVNGANKAVTIKNLICNTAYEWKIRTLCDTVGIDVASPFSATKTFTTGACRMAANASNESEEMEIEVYPNPVINYATLAFNIDSPGEANIVIMDITGRVVKQFSLMNLAMGINQVGFDTSELTNGVYYVRIIQNDKIAGKKLVIEK